MLAPGASYGPSKFWPADSFAHVGDALCAAGARVVVLGTPAERELAGRVCAAMRGPVVAYLSFCGGDPDKPYSSLSDSILAAISAFIGPTRSMTIGDTCG